MFCLLDPRVKGLREQNGERVSEKKTCLPAGGAQTQAERKGQIT